MNKNKILLLLVTLTTIFSNTLFFAEVEAEMEQLGLEQTADEAVYTANDIFEAVNENNLKDIKKFVKDANKTDEEGNTPLNLACLNYSPNENDSADKLKLIEFLVKNSNQESINKKNNEGKTPLLNSCENLDVIKILLENGAKDSLTIADTDGNIPLHHVCGKSLSGFGKSDLEIIKLLIQYDTKKETVNYSQTNKLKNGITPLILACLSREKDKGVKLKVVEFLLNSGATINQDTLVKTIWKITTDIAKLLLSKTPKELFSKTDHNGNTLLNLAAINLLMIGLTTKTDSKEGEFTYNIYSDVIEAIVQNDTKKESVNKANNDGRTPLHFALGNLKLLRDDFAKSTGNKGAGNKEVKTEVKTSANKNPKDIKQDFKKMLEEDDIETYEPLSLEKRLRSIKFLLNNGAKESINKADKDGLTPLHIACNWDNLELIKLLIKDAPKGLVNSADKKGHTPFYYACKISSGDKQKNLDIITFLLDNGATVDKSSYEKASLTPEIKEHIDKWLKKNNKTVV